MPLLYCSFMAKLLILISFFLVTNAHAWRETGHYSVCEIGYRLAKPETRKILDTIFEGQRFAVHCTWPDLVRKTEKYAYSYPYHFINLDDGEEYFSTISPKGDALQGILKMEDYLRSERSVTLAPVIKLGAKSRKIRESLKFLGHFVGDIHQPLHVGRRKDLGGNRIFVKWDNKETHPYQEFKLIEGGHISGKTEEKNINLHKCIDLHVFEKFIEENKLTLDKTGTAFMAYTDFILSGKITTLPKLSSKEIMKLQASTPQSWMEESLEQREALYNVSAKDNLSGEYYNQMINSIHKRVREAGVRLAGILDRIFTKNQKLSQSEVELREKIKKALDKQSN